MKSNLAYLLLQASSNNRNRWFNQNRLFRTEGPRPERPALEMLTLYRSKRVDDFTSNGILNGNGDEWWRIRSKAQVPFLKATNITTYYLPALGDIAEEFVDRIRLIRQANNEMKPDFINEMYRWALECINLFFNKNQNLILN